MGNIDTVFVRQGLDVDIEVNNQLEVVGLLELLDRSNDVKQLRRDHVLPLESCLYSNV